MKSQIIERYFDTIQKQRANIYSKIENISDDLVWEEIVEKKWSISQHFEHLYKMIRLFRKSTSFYKPIAYPLAYIFKNRPYKTDTTDVYAEYIREGKKMKAPFVIIPKHNKDNPISFNKLKEDIEDETNQLKNILNDMEENIAGHIRFFDPVVNHPNLIQSVQIIGFHEINHFNIIKGLISKIK